MRNFLIISVLLLVAACRPLTLQMVTPTGPPEYTLGWEDGCDSGLSAEGSLEYKLLYGFKKRAEMASSDQYKQGWNEGFTYCRFSLAASKGDDGLAPNLGWGQGSDVHANESLPW